STTTTRRSSASATPSSAPPRWPDPSGAEDGEPAAGAPSASGGRFPRPSLGPQMDGADPDHAGAEGSQRFEPSRGQVEDPGARAVRSAVEDVHEHVPSVGPDRDERATRKGPARRVQAVQRLPARSGGPGA